MLKQQWCNLLWKMMSLLQDLSKFKQLSSPTKVKATMQAVFTFQQFHFRICVLCCVPNHHHKWEHMTDIIEVTLKPGWPPAPGKDNSSNWSKIRKYRLTFFLVSRTFTSWALARDLLSPIHRNAITGSPLTPNVVTVHSGDDEKKTKTQTTIQPIHGSLQTAQILEKLSLTGKTSSEAKSWRILSTA